MVRVMVSGKFDPCHDGHIEHIVKAASLGDHLIVVTHSDEILRKIKGRCNMSLWARMVVLCGILLYYGIDGEVVLSCDIDGGSTETLRKYTPDIFAKGGDRTPDNMPENEIRMCDEIGCKIVYGVGEQLNSSSTME